MATQEKTIWSRMRKKLTNRLLSGMLLLMPFGVTLLVMRWIFGWVAGLVKPIIIRILHLLSLIPLVDSLPDSLTTFCVIVFTIFVLLAIVYLVGVIGQRILGKQILKAAEQLVQRIPFVRAIYSASKQVIESVSLPGKAAFKSVVIVEFPRPGFKSIGFLTGQIQDSTGKTFCKVFIPTAPNPTTGFFEIIPPDEVTETNLTMEDAFKMILSGGMVAPDTLEALGKSKATSGSKQTDKPYAKSSLT
ncbi:MAG: DUF502 domain-containing protein [Sedimentisphaerales bacterium]|jgi:uncharacterized membrane protein|nr:DUF502 domain-containing protein [Sedimentisphaerales bacterium]